MRVRSSPTSSCTGTWSARRIHGLPNFVEEGLAELVAARVTGSEPRLASFTEDHPLTASTLQATDWEWMELPAMERAAAERLGFEVVEKLGLEGLAALVAARATPAQYLEATSLEPLVRATRSATGEAVQYVFLAADGQVLGEAIQLDADGHGTGQVPPGAVRMELRVLHAAEAP